MANAVYPKYKESVLSELTSSNVIAVLVDLADYTYSTAHDFLDDVPVGARVATSSNLTAKSVTDGVFDAADVTFSAVTGDASEALLIAISTGNDATSKVVAFMDTGITGMPVTPNGGDINVTWDSGANKIFAL